jgi:CARDB
MRTVVGIFAVGVLLWSTAAAGAAPKPRADLAVSSLGNPPAAVQRGDSFTVRDEILNRGRMSAKASVTSYYLSLDKRRTRGDVLLGQRSLGRLKRGRRSKATTELTVPADTPPGAYRLLACADAAKRLKEKSERNNCRASGTTLQVTAEQPALGGNGGLQGGGGVTVTSPAHEAGTENGGGGAVTPPAACANGIDDDADGLIDAADDGCFNEFDKSERKELCNGGIDDDDDPLTPEIGATVTFPNAIGQCQNGVPRLVSCLPNWHDIDGFDANGCEYFAVFVSPNETCDGTDENANGMIDEGLVLPSAVPHGAWTCSGADGFVLICEPGFEDTDPTQPGCEAIEP